MLDILNSCGDLKKIEIRIDPSKMLREDYHDWAFMFLIEKVNSLMKELKSEALLITDHDKDMVSINVTSLSMYKEQGTKFQFGSKIDHIVDTVHHTHSHHSRLVQMADIFTYTMALQPKEGMKFPRDAILNYAREHTQLTIPSKYKYWPTNQSWYRAA